MWLFAEHIKHMKKRKDEQTEHQQNSKPLHHQKSKKISHWFKKNLLNNIFNKVFVFKNMYRTLATQ